MDIELLRSAPAAEGSSQTVGEALSEVVGTVRENMQLRRAYRCVRSSCICGLMTFVVKRMISTLSAS